MVNLRLIPSDFFLIDCSSIMAFSGADFANPRRFCDYRERIWTHLEGMIATDRLKTVSQAWAELEYNDPESCVRLHRFRDRLILPMDHMTDIRIINIISKHPRIVDHNQHYTREPADPYLIAYAQKHAAIIISDEKPLSARIGQNKNRKTTIPDVCIMENMKCLSLEAFLKDQGVIPPNFA